MKARFGLVALIVLLATGLPTAQAKHNTCDNEPDGQIPGDIWIDPVGVDPSPNPGVCVRDRGIFFDASGPGLASIGISSCRYPGPRGGSSGCTRYNYYGLHEPPQFALPACIKWKMYDGSGSYWTYHASGVCEA